MILLKIFLSFIQVGLFSVGGGYAAIPLIQNQIVDIHKLITLSEFTDLITIAEMTPGSISINAATFVGIKLSGISGAIICTIGCILPSFIICSILARFYYKYKNLRAVQTILSALRPAVVSLIASAGLSILLLGLFQTDKSNIVPYNFRYIEFILFLASLFIIRKFKVNAISIILGTGVIGTLLYTIF